MHSSVDSIESVRSVRSVTNVVVGAELAQPLAAPRAMSAHARTVDKELHHVIIIQLDRLRDRWTHDSCRWRGRWSGRRSYERERRRPRGVCVSGPRFAGRRLCVRARCCCGRSLEQRSCRRRLLSAGRDGQRRRRRRRRGLRQHAGWDIGCRLLHVACRHQASPVTGHGKVRAFGPTLT